MVKQYHDRDYPEVMRDNLYYRLKRAKKPLLEEAERTVENSLIGTVISPSVTGEITDNSNSSKSGGRPKCSMKMASEL